MADVNEGDISSTCPRAQKVIFASFLKKGKLLT